MKYKVIDLAQIREILRHIISYHIIYIVCYSRLNIRQPKVDMDLQNKINPNYNQTKSPRKYKTISVKFRHLQVC